ncbi:transcription factor 25-like [Planoprotostelium fungivorum]|uniref:Transcription factor 25-like n=1 Tax=Planoprotostelium fungivorum TaxID=1890364 RepID=A0A2P6N5X3_9EUKA|nr:transcription factor 25-like [Planoprotostelium fungivorum]
MTSNTNRLLKFVMGQVAVALTMSGGRALQKARKQALSLAVTSKEEESSDEEEEVIQQAPSRVKNAFDLLNEGEEEEVAEEEEEEEEEVEVKPVKETSLNSKKNNKKNKKKNKKKTAASSKQDAEDIDEIIEKNKTRLGKQDASEGDRLEEDQWSLLKTEAIHLNPDNELVKLFGRQTVKEAQKEQKQSRRVATFRKTQLLKPKEDWPNPAANMLMSMEVMEVVKNETLHRIVWSPQYQTLQAHFYDCVQSYDPHSFQSLLRVYPYHIDSLLQLSSFCNQTGQFDMAMDLLERAIFAFESVWLPTFDPLSARCRMPYSVEENRPFFLALFKYVQMLGREGTSRTALEYCKLLLSLDPEDPLYILFVIDYYAVRSAQYEFVTNMYKSNLFTAKNLSLLPNWTYSVALATFRSQGSKSSAEGTDECDLMLQNALKLFPMVLSPLAKKAGMSLQKVDPTTKLSEDMSKHGYFVDFSVNPTSLQHLVTLFVERNFTLWRDAEVVRWVKKNMAIVLSAVEKGDVMVTNYETVLKEEYVKNERDTFNHLLLSEYTDNIAQDALPADVVNAMRGGGQAEIYEGFQAAQAARAANAPRIHATTNDPLLLFLQTLLPWNETPNAPPLVGQGDNAGWMNAIRGLIQQQQNNPQGNPPANPPNQ